MKLLLICMMVINLYAQDLKTRIQTLIAPPEKHSIVQIKYDPFKKAQEVVEKTFKNKKQEQTLHVTTILNGKVFVNSNWHGVGDRVDGYKIIQIREEGILAKKSGKVVKFGIKRKKSIVKVEDK